MKLTIEPNLFDTFPRLRIGVLIVCGLDNTRSGDLRVLRAAETRARTDMQGDLIENPKIVDWRNAYKAFGAKPSKHRSSVEALLRRVSKGDDIPDINPLVNCYNAVSITHVLPAGGDDLDKVDGNIVLAFANGNEAFNILGSEKPESPKEGEVIYRDDSDVLCRRWNWRESHKTRMTEQTKNAILLIEALESTTDEELAAALGELRNLVVQHCGGKAHTCILDSTHPGTDITST